eukprot:Tbor_TRINITY_DN4911_c0_g1::TRINITY_DN4911_c0_g1_i1::g.9623::m.9623
MSRSGDIVSKGGRALCRPQDNHLTDMHEEVASIQTRETQRRKLNFPSAEERRQRAAEAFTTMVYPLPRYLAPSDGSTAVKFKSKADSGAQTALQLQQYTTVGDVQMYETPCERHIDIDLKLPNVSELPVISFPQLLKAERRLCDLLVSIELELQRISEEQKMKASQSEGNKGRDDNVSAFLYGEWADSVSVSSNTNRIQATHKRLEEGIRASQREVSIEQYRMSLMSRTGQQKTPLDKPQLIAHYPTHAADYMIEKKPYLISTGNALPPSGSGTVGTTIGSDNTPHLGNNRISSKAQRSQSRGMQIAMSKHHFYTNGKQ